MLHYVTASLDGQLQSHRVGALGAPWPRTPSQCHGAHHPFGHGALSVLGTKAQNPFTEGSQLLHPAGLLCPHGG